MTNGQRISLEFTSGNSVDGTFNATVVDANNFTVTASALSTSGNVTMKVTDYTGTSNGDCKGAGRETVNVNSGTAFGATSPPSALSLIHI